MPSNTGYVSPGRPPEYDALLREGWPGLVYRIEIKWRQPPIDRDLIDDWRRDGIAVEALAPSRLFYLEGALSRSDVEHIATDLLTDPITEHYEVRGEGDLDAGKFAAFEIHPRPGVMDPVAETVLAELRAEGFAVESVRSGRRFIVKGEHCREGLEQQVYRTLANACVDEVVVGSKPIAVAPQPKSHDARPRKIPIRGLTDEQLVRLSRTGHLFLSLDEMRVVQKHFAELGREPTDLELETLAQTWSEHCVHKTLKSEVEYHGAGFGLHAAGTTVRYRNLLRETIVKATEELIAERRGPTCLSVFKDNAGIIAFDETHALAFKVETHNHPSAIEPYGGAATGVGGCIRDVLGCGLGAKPIANTDVFCVAPDWGNEALPKGVIHPRRLLREVARGVADYGNRMGIPTVNGAVSFDPRYLGNPLVYCGCVGLIPRDRIAKAARDGDWIVLIGGRTGRDGIHGATFSSAELSDSHSDEFSHAVQIGNAITERRCMEAILRARDAQPRPLFSAITDCGAGGLSSAVGEMGAEIGVEVDLEKAPLKYAGLRYDEIWISEAQERMVLATSPECLDDLLKIMAEEEVEAAVIGRFGVRDGQGRPRLIVRYHGGLVGELDMAFVHDGLPRRARRAEWTRNVTPPRRTASPAPLERLCAELSAPNTRSKEWIIRAYDHEVQGGSVIKPLCGRGLGPSDAAVLRPRLDSYRGFALGCGLAQDLFDIDPYWMALAAIDEAIRNVVCVGGDPRKTALLDNFCWGKTDDPRQLGGLVRACQGCYDGAKAHGAPFISGKDSLNNEFALDPTDLEAVADSLTRRLRAQGYSDDRVDAIVSQVRASGRLAIPGTLLISALSLVQDVWQCVSADLKRAGNHLLLVGGLPQIGHDPRAAAAVSAAVADAIQSGGVAACHDVSDGGWLVAAAEMAIAGALGVHLEPTEDLFDPLIAGYVLEATDAGRLAAHFTARRIRVRPLGKVLAAAEIRLGAEVAPLARLSEAWRGPLSSPA